MNSHHFLTILGLGNILLGDEGFGVHFIRWFSERHQFSEGVELLDGGTLGFRLLDPITECDHLIVIDVIKLEDDPGAIYRFTRDEIQTHLPPPASAHEVEFLDVLIQAELIGRIPEVVFLVIVPEKYGDMVLEMTPRMHEKYHDMERLLLAELSRLDISPIKK